MAHLDFYEGGDASQDLQIEVLETHSIRIEQILSSLVSSPEMSRRQNEWQNRIDDVATQIETLRTAVTAAMVSLQASRQAIDIGGGSEFSVTGDTNDVVHGFGIKPLVQVIDVAGIDITSTATTRHLSSTTVRVSGTGGGFNGKVILS